MKKHDETITSEQLRDLKVFKRIFFIFLMFCFAESANGSCLSYGHSCWGAHGKRSYNGIPQHRQTNIREDEHPMVGAERNGISARTNGRNPWLLSHLITERLAIPAAASLIGKHPGNRWHKPQSIVTLPEIWGDDYETARNEIFRNEKAALDKNIDDSKDLRDSLELSRKIAKFRDERTDFLLAPSRKEYDNHRPSPTRKLLLYKILTKSSGNDALQ